MRCVNRENRPPRTLRGLRTVREYTWLIGQIVLDLKPLIIVLAGIGVFFSVGESLRQVVSLLAQ